MLKTQYYRLVMGIAGILLRHATRIAPVINPSLESAVKGLDNAKYYETTVASRVPVHDFVDERGWMWRYDNRENLDVW